MTLENLVPSLDTCRRMGWSRPTIYAWHGKTLIGYTEKLSSASSLVFAPTVSEMLAEMPDFIHVYKDAHVYVAVYEDAITIDTDANSAAEALALLWIELKERGIVK